MQVTLILLVAVGFATVVVGVVVALCRAAKRSDEATDGALANEIAIERDAQSTHPPATRRRLRTLSLDHAAMLVDVEPETLLAWEARYGFPTSSPSERRYNQSEILALRSGLEDGLSVSSAITRAREQAKRRRAGAAVQSFDHRGGGLAS